MTDETLPAGFLNVRLLRRMKKGYLEGKAGM